MKYTGFPGYYTQSGVQFVTRNGQSNELRCRNYTDANGNPSGGYVTGVGITITWQDGLRGEVGGMLNMANGAFVEDALQAAAQRLWFFQQSKFAHDDNAQAIEYIQKAIDVLGERAKERQARNVLGTHAV
jgi:hypothetical protein